MNEIVNKLLLTGDMFILSLHLRHLEFTYSPFGLFTEQFQNFKETGDSHYSYKNKLNITCFANDVAHANGKNLAKRTILNRILKDNA